jgi:hypothetical protein
VVSANCTPGDNGNWLCANRTGVDAGNNAKTAGLLSTFGLGAGAGGLAIGTLLLVTEPSPDKPAKRGQWTLRVAASGQALRIQGSW